MSRTEVERLQQRLDQQRTGSVYLDRPIPTPNRRPPAPKRRLSRTTVASACLLIGLLTLSAAAVLAGLRSLVFDTDPWMTAFDETLDDPAARPEIEREVARGIEHGLVGAELAEDVAFFGFDVAAEAEAIAGIVLDDPAVRAELRLLLEDAHAQVLVERSGATLDLEPISAAVFAVVEREAPELASIVPAGATLWSIETDSLPDLTWTAGLTDRGVRSLALGGLLIPLGVIVHPRRHRAASWVGRSLLVGGLVAALTAVGLPYLAGAMTGWIAAEIVVRSITLKLLGPAAIAGIIGMGLVSFAAVMSHRERRRTADEGAAAALGYDEPAPWAQPGAPTLDLASRGLVDVNHPLTNI